MPARDIYHECCKNALIKDGWTITDDPLRLEYGKKDLYIDLGAERLIAARRAGEKIAVEIKSFVGRSDIADLENALGQYTLYSDLLAEIAPDKKLYLAVRDRIYENVFEEPIGQLLLTRKRLKLMVFDPDQEEIVLWID